MSNGQILFRYYGNTLSIQQSGASTDGYLSAADWNRFNTVATTAWEKFLGYPTVDGNVLASSSLGVRYWTPAEKPLTFEASLYRNGNIVTLANDMPGTDQPGVQMYYGMTSTGVRGWFNLAQVTAGVRSWNTRTGDVMPQAGDYTAAQVGAEVPLTFQSSLYRNGNIITLLNDAPVTAPGVQQYYGQTSAGVRGWFNLAAGVTSVFGRTGAVVAQAGDYAAFYQPLGSYESPLTFQYSLTRNGNAINLVGDVAGAGPSATQYYGTNAAGTRGWYNLPASSVPGGATTQLQFNDSGAFAGSPVLTLDKVNNIFTVGDVYPAHGQLRVRYADTTYGTGGLRITSTQTGADVVLQAVVGPPAAVYITTPAGAAGGLLLGSWMNPSGGGIFTAGSGGYYLSGGANTRLGVGAVMFTATQLSVLPISATTKGLAIKSAASQSANLTEWQDSNGNVLSSISSAGVFSGPITAIDSSFFIQNAAVPTKQIQFVLGSLTAQRTITPADGSSITVLPSIAPTSPTGPTGTQQQYMLGITTAGAIQYQLVNCSDLAGTLVASQGGVPTAGLANQVLVKNSNTAYDYSWKNSTGIPAGGAIGYVLTKNSATDYDVSWAAPPGGGGGGTVTSFSAGVLAPIFTTTVSTATSTPALAFVLTATPAGHQFLGNNTGASGLPTYVQPAFTDLAGAATNAQLPATISGKTFDTGTITNTTIGDTNTISVKATLFTLEQAAVPANTAKFILTGLTSAVTIAVPNANSTLVIPTSAPTTGPGQQQYMIGISATGAIVYQAIPFSDITGKPTTLAGYGITDPVVLTSSSYADPSWITALAWSKITGAPAFEPALGNPASNGQVLSSTTGGTRSWITLTSAPVSSVFTRTGAIVAAAGDYAAFYPSLTGSYADPAWITALAWGKITGAPAFESPLTFQYSVTRNGNVINLVGDVPSTSLSALQYYGTDGTGTRGWYNLPPAPPASEPPLGNPAANGYLLSSTVAGVRSWVAPPSAGVTTVVVGSASPLFTATPSTPVGGAVSIAFTLAQANAKTFWGQSAGTGPAVPGFVQVAFSDLAGTPTTLAGYGIASPLPIAQGGTGVAANAPANSVFNNLTAIPAAPSFSALAALTSVNDTNVTMTLGGTPATALIRAVSLTLGWSGTLATSRGGTGNTLGAEPPLGSPAANGYLLSSTTGGVRSWIAPAGAPAGAALTSVNDTNVTMTLGGTPATALLVAASMTLGWTGFLSTARGGLGAQPTPATAGEVLRSLGTTTFDSFPPNVVQAQPANPTGTASATGVMMGLNQTLQMQYGSRVLVIISGRIASNTASQFAGTQIRYGTGTAPANGAAPTGTAVGTMLYSSATANISENFTLQAVIQGLTKGTIYWFDLLLNCSAAATGSLLNVCVSVVEL